MIEFSPVLVFAVLFLVALALIPYRYWYVKLPAVLGWVLVWFDGEFTGHWTDSLGLAVTGLSLLWLLMTAKRREDQDRPRN
ncbi:hypothetical protein [Lentzea sp. NPDC051838]|uniref:hypothetical protein n=1 Tax=Lentzea sp. NPDC051838 TaxID=3154849 RepID=UPI003435336E